MNPPASEALRWRSWQRLMLAVGLLSVAILVAVGVFRSQAWAARPTTSLATFTENAVAVEIALEYDSAGQPWLAGTFTPTRENFHVYSKDLPKQGLKGLGRPTRLEIVSPGAVTATGALSADQPEISQYNRVIEQSLPVYPAGPVTLRLPVILPTAKEPISIELSITYMACNDEICLTPVIDKHLAVVIRP